MTGSELRKKFDSLVARRELYIEQVHGFEEEIHTLKDELDSINKAQAVLQSVAQETQEQLKFHVESIVTMAFEAVFPDPYGFQIDFVAKRGKTEAECFFVRDGIQFDPMSSVGGGAVDIASFALRCTVWSLERTQPVIVMDEPFRFVSRDLQEKTGRIMQELSEKLGIQFILVTHNADMVIDEHTVFEVTQKNGKSKVSLTSG